jgi:uncharacterized protein YjbI with pentapeptide repeats
MFEKNKTQFEIEKLKAETADILYRHSAQGKRIEWLKALAGFGAAISGIVALIGLFVSIWRWQDELNLNINTKTQEQITKAFDNLSDQNIAKRLSGVASLRSLLSEKNAARQKLIIDTSIGMLSIEKEEVVRDAIIWFYKSFSLDFINKETLEHTLYTLVNTNRGLVKKNRLYFWRIDSDPRETLKSDSEEAIAMSVGEAITTLLHIGVRNADISGIYCVKCDFSGIDLPNVNLSKSILFMSNFSNSNLMHSNFNNADLEGTNFRRANLQFAKITSINDEAQTRDGDLNYVEKAYRRKKYRSHNNQIEILAPNFDCANLEKTDFEGFPLFGISSKKTYLREGSPSLIPNYASFRGTKLKDTKFKKAKIFGEKLENQAPPFPFITDQELGIDNLSKYSGFHYLRIDKNRNSKVVFYQAYLSDKIKYRDVDTHNYMDSLIVYGFSTSFSDKNWRNSELPLSVQAWLEKQGTNMDIDC